MTVRLQLVSLIALLSGCFGLFTALYFPSNQRQASLEALRKELVNIETLAADLLGPAIMFDDRAGIQQTAEYLMRLNEAAFLVIRNAQGERLVERANPLHEAALATYLDETSDRPAGLLLESVPIETAAGAVGSLSLAFHTMHVDAIVADARRTSVAVGLLFLLFGLIAAVYVGVRLVKPLPAITDAFVALSEGAFDHEVPETGAREFVALSQAFNRTRATLRWVFDQITLSNVQLNEEIAERKRAEAQITASLHEKEILLKEIHHRVKNNLQVISSLLSLQSGYIRDPESMEVFKDSQTRVRSMALIHEKLYQSKDLSGVDFQAYLSNLAGHLFRTYAADPSRIALDVDVDPIVLDLDTAVPCGLLVNELVSNALKHAFPDGRRGRIAVRMIDHGDDSYALIVADDGVGFPAGMDLATTNSLGLQLVHTLCEQLDGRLDVGGHPGAEFRIGFAAAHYKERV